MPMREFSKLHTYEAYIFPNTSLIVSSGQAQLGAAGFETINHPSGRDFASLRHTTGS